MLRSIFLVLVGVFSFAQLLMAQDVCKAYRPDPMVPTDPALCESLKETVRHPFSLRLDKHEEALNQFFGNWCHRDSENGWVSDKFVREIGPYTTRFTDGDWTDNKYYGFHAPVVIWYSPEAFEWIKENRSHEEADISQEPVVLDGAMIIKEMLAPPSSVCRDVDVTHLYPQYGAAIMIRDTEASHDGWFWGYYG
ncbi:MAG: hypothetical protein GKR95_19270 [Gammaproteobacteria bacterium]|nr:hypothetical protein [Gammaproteobacteria bacterium]